MKDRVHCSEKKIDWNRRLHKQLTLDDLRVRSMQNKIQRMISSQNLEASQAQIPMTSGINLQTLNYIVTVGLGSQKMTVVVDTASDLTWVQCEPCLSCYNQQEPLFRPSTSPSYQPIPCNSTTCQSLLPTDDPEGCGTSSSCDYTVTYGDGSYTFGELGVENLNLGDISVRNFVFGCGRNNKGLFGTTSGVLGLGRSNLSLISQAGDTFGGVFSYCLPATKAGASGSLTLGNEFSVFKNVTPIAYTKMVHNPQLPQYYMLNLTGTQVGGVALQAPSFGTGGVGVLIDSGTVITRLPPSIYNALKAEFLNQFSGFPSAPGVSLFDTCFDVTGIQQVNVPTIRMYFEGNAELHVDVAGVLVIIEEDASSSACLAIASLADESGIGIIGNFQQKNQRVIYDTKQSLVGFAKEPCSFT